MPKHRLVAIDVDGTLLGRNWKIPEQNVRAVAAVQARGVGVTLATGRTFQTTEPFLRKLKLTLPAICYHGALIRTKQKIYFSRLVPRAHVRALIRYGFSHGVQVALFCHEQVYFNKPLDQWGREYVNSIEPVREVNLVDLLTYKFPDRLHKVMFVASARKIHSIERSAHRKFGRYLTITRSHPKLLEFVPLKVSKGKALRWIAHHLGLRMPNVMAIGDNGNDLSMLQMAGLGVAVGNAPRIVKKKVDWVSTRAERHGVAKALRKFVLEKE
jgi:Cof subfamily protein (haloacid dehalogenase superfamily)